MPEDPTSYRDARPGSDLFNKAGLLMNVNKLSTSSTQHTAADGRIYKDSKGRSVGLAGKVNRVTNTVDVPERFPLQTPEDKRHMDALFNRCSSHAEKYLQSKK